jgi:hypothetical protein
MKSITIKHTGHRGGTSGVSSALSNVAAITSQVTVLRKHTKGKISNSARQIPMNNHKIPRRSSRSQVQEPSEGHTVLQAMPLFTASSQVANFPHPQLPAFVKVREMEHYT